MEVAWTVVYLLAEALDDVADGEGPRSRLSPIPGW